MARQLFSPHHQGEEKTDRESKQGDAEEGGDQMTQTDAKSHFNT